MRLFGKLDLAARGAGLIETGPKAVGFEDAGDLGEVRGLPRGRGAEGVPCAVGAGGQLVEDLLRGTLAAVGAAGLAGGALVLARRGLDLLGRGMGSDLESCPTGLAQPAAGPSWGQNEAGRRGKHRE